MRIYIIFIFIIFSTCSPKQKESYEIDYNLLQGNWIGYNRVLTFWDSLVSNPTTYGQHLVPYSVSIDTLYVLFEVNVDQIRDYIIINQLTDDSLHYTYESTVYKFSKPKHLKPIKFDEIQLSSGLCHGNCPKLSLKILKDGSFYYEGELFTKLTGSYSGTISNKYIDRLNDILQLYDLDNFQTKDTIYAPAGDQYFSIYLKYNGDNQINYFGSYNEHYTDLIFRLMETWKFANLRKDSTEYFYRTKFDTNNF